MIAETDLFDVLIIGGGVVGNALALALAHTPLKIGVVEAQPQSAENMAEPSRDERAIALTNASIRIFESLKIWENIKPYATPIHQVHVSDAGHFGSTKFSATDLGFSTFGYVVPAHILTDSLQAQVLSAAQLTPIYSAKLEALTAHQIGYSVQIRLPDETRTLYARLLVGADGAQSLTRKLLNLSVKQVDYHQMALVAKVRVSKPHAGVAYERFTPAGPLAALPISDHHFVIIWTGPTRQMEQQQELSDEALQSKLQKMWGYRLGRILSIETRQTFPLRSVFAENQVCPGAILLGNAAHTLHPVAAQGLNLSLKDMAVLVDKMLEAISLHQDPTRFALLETYMETRQKDQKSVMRFTNNLLQLFSQELSPIVFARNAGLSSLNILPFAKKMFVKRAMGLAGRLPSLMRR